MRWLVILVSLFLAGGCNALGALASKLPPRTVPAAYDGLTGQTAMVMVYADPATRIDFSTLPLNLSYALQSNLRQAEQVMDTVRGVTFPYEPERVVRWQEEHPRSEYAPAAEWAPALPVDRLIYVEVEGFSTRAPGSPQLFLGTGVANVYVYAIGGVSADRTAELVFQDDGIRVTFPETAGGVGLPDANDEAIYRGTVRALADELAVRFVSRPEED